ncbi:MAG: alpha-ribazole phosphatase [Gammaproteobacteria bacterium]|nr:alpha-ribazole phosphatase [Gammaproteobacteria bacterium]MDH5777043.1 alpha-ribazole phosphatase [Gammaproteobacteria bacterium]
MTLSTTIDLIRHGEPEGGTRYRGHTDDPLSELGWQQMRTAVQEHKPWDAIISSPLLRCFEFAQEIAQKNDIVISAEDRFKEIFFGPWEGKTAEEIMQLDPDSLSNFWADPVTHMPAGAETLTEFRDRVMQAWDDVIQQHRGKHLLVVGHGGMMRMILSHILEMPMNNMFRLSVKYAAMSRVRIDHYLEQDLPIIKFHNGSL